MKFVYYKKDKGFLTREYIIDFLYQHLIRFRDPKDQINKCIDYALSKQKMAGGFILCAIENAELRGVVVMIETGMSGYIPENFLVYAAVHGEHRGKGIGSRLIEQAIEKTEGDVALHVEYDNPAQKLYERLGFTNKYAEMRFQR